MAITVGTNSWTTLAEAETYFNERIGTFDHWGDSLLDSDKKSSLITAYKQLTNCGLFSFPAITTQKMKDAQYEQALFLIIHIEDMDRRMGLQAQGVKAAGIVKETYKDKAGEKIAIAPLVMQLLSDLKTEQNLYAIDLERDESEDVI